MTTIQNTFAAAGTGANVFKSNESRPEGTFTSWARLTGTGAVTATLVVEFTNDPAGLVGWKDFQTITLSGSDDVYDGITNFIVPGCVRHRCTAISGTAASLLANTRAI